MGELIRTPDRYFENLEGFPYSPNYVEVNGTRIHYIDEGESDEVILCLHGEPSWSYLYRKFVPVLSPTYRLIAMDLVGFGRSDKYVDQADYTYKMHFDTVKGFIEALDLRNITLVVQDWGGLLGLPVLSVMEERFARVVIMNTFLPVGKRPMPAAFNAWKNFVKMTPILPIGKILQKGTHTELSKEVVRAYNAPFPKNKYKAGARVFPMMVPTSPEDDGVKEMLHAREVLRNWQKPALVMFSDKDPIMRGGEKYFLHNIPTAQARPYYEIKGAGHFLQEDKGEEIAERIKMFMEE